MFKSERQDHSGQDATGGLRDIRIFANLAPKELALLASECAWCRFSRGDIINSVGSGDNEVWLVVRGAVRLARSTGPDGRIVYSDIDAGGQFGEMSFFGVDDADLTAIAREDCLLAAMPEAVFVELLSREESVSRALLCQYANLLRHRDAVSAAASATMPGATGMQRIYGELLALAEPRMGQGDTKTGLFIARMPRHRELADRLATTEEVVAGAVAELVRLGVAEREYPGLLILDEGALRSLCKSA
ncbi:MAG: Crp/Fnr family transcriptional regulator [Parvibaculum sp.]|nr:Crp/Fnr family transcriptional regulator [Parvibaculum sp.]